MLSFRTAYRSPRLRRGFRPLDMGEFARLEGQKQDTIVLASETCAFDITARPTNAKSSRESW